MSHTHLVSSLSQIALKSYNFLISACVCLLGCIYTFFLLPETKGKTMLEISEEFKTIAVCRKSFVDKTEETKLWCSPDAQAPGKF